MVSNYSNSLFKDNERLQIKLNESEKERKFQKLRADIAESEQQRLEKEMTKKDEIINEKDKIIDAQNKKILELLNKLDITTNERDKYLSQLNLDGTTGGIPTSQTPINKKKVTPNSRKNTGEKPGGKFGHKKYKLVQFSDEEINEHKIEILDKCPHCGSHELEELDEEVIKDEFDYEIKIIKRRVHFRKQKCKKCGKVIKKSIPNNLKEENQYGSKVQATALTLMNVGNVPINKVRRIISGFTFQEIVLSEGYISKLQKRCAKKLDKFIDDLKFYITHLSVVYWDDTVVMVSTKRSCMRFYGNHDVALYCAHEHKDMKGLDTDNILNLLGANTIVEHDHNIVNYNDKYSFINAECCQHLERDLEKVSVNLPNRTWSKCMKELFQEYNHKRKLLIENGEDRFSDEDFNEFIGKINQYILLGTEEYLLDTKAYYADKEEALLIRLMEYRDNYIYWALDFNLDYTNNVSERALRGVKSKMKASGQFQNIENTRYYATIRSYIETCHRNGVNEHEAIEKLINGNPYSLDDILKIGKENAEKRA